MSLYRPDLNESYYNNYQNLDEFHLMTKKRAKKLAMLGALGLGTAGAAYAANRAGYLTKDNIQKGIGNIKYRLDVRDAKRIRRDRNNALHRGESNVHYLFDRDENGKRHFTGHSYVIK